MPRGVKKKDGDAQDQDELDIAEEALESDDSEELLEVKKIEFPDLKVTGANPYNSGFFDNIPVKVTVELGSSMVSLKDVYELGEGSIIELDRHAGEPLDLLVNGQLIARGEVVAIDDNYGLKIKTVIKPGK